MANRYVEQIIKTQQIQLNEQKKEISKKFDNIDQVLNNISKKVDNVNRTIASTTTLSFNNVMFSTVKLPHQNRGKKKNMLFNTTLTFDKIILHLPLLYQ